MEHKIRNSPRIFYAKCICMLVGKAKFLILFPSHLFTILGNSVATDPLLSLTIFIMPHVATVFLVGSIGTITITVCYVSMLYGKVMVTFNMQIVKVYSHLTVLVIESRSHWLLAITGVN